MKNKGITKNGRVLYFYFSKPFIIDIFAMGLEYLYIIVWITVKYCVILQENNVYFNLSKIHFKKLFKKIFLNNSKNTIMLGEQKFLI